MKIASPRSICVCGAAWNQNSKSQNMRVGLLWSQIKYFGLRNYGNARRSRKQTKRPGAAVFGVDPPAGQGFPGIGFGRELQGRFVPLVVADADRFGNVVHEHLAVSDAAGS